MINFVLIFIVALISLVLVNGILKFKPFNINKLGLKETLLFLFYAIFLISIPEEIIFRGLIQTYLVGYYGIFFGLKFSSLIFGLAHLFNRKKSFKIKDLNWKLSCMTFTLGLFLGYIYYLTDSLLFPTLMHLGFLVLARYFLK